MRRFQDLPIRRKVSVVILAVFTIEGFVSLWCAYAAVSAGAIAWHTRRSALAPVLQDAG